MTIEMVIGGEIDAANDHLDRSLLVSGTDAGLVDRQPHLPVTLKTARREEPPEQASAWNA